jgi:molecular chaperone GrpE
MAEKQQKPKNEKTAAESDQPTEQIIEATTAPEVDNQGANPEDVQQPSETDVEQLKAELADTRKQLQDAKDSVLRALAEAQNAKHRADRAVEQAHKFGLEKIIQELLPVVDNLERSLEVKVNIDEAFVTALRGGVEMTLNQFQTVLGKFKVEVVDPEGQPFDPRMHQAMSIVENENVEPNTVVAVMQKGYTLNDRLVRPAMVMVSKAAAGSAKIDEQA